MQHHQEKEIWASSKAGLKYVLSNDVLQIKMCLKTIIKESVCLCSQFILLFWNTPYVCNSHIILLPSYLVVFSVITWHFFPYLNSHNPNPHSFTCMPLSTKQLEGFRFPCEFSGLLWINSIPYKNRNIIIEFAMAKRTRYNGCCPSTRYMEDWNLLGWTEEYSFGWDFKNYKI